MILQREEAELLWVATAGGKGGFRRRPCDGERENGNPKREREIWSAEELTKDKCARLVFLSKSHAMHVMSLVG